jgi:hypothetical protein
MFTNLFIYIFGNVSKKNIDTSINKNFIVHNKEKKNISYNLNKYNNIFNKN